MGEGLDKVVLSYYDCLLRRSDVELLKGPYWINDALIGFYFEYLDKKYNKDEQKEIVFVSPELTQLLKMTDSSQYKSFLEPIGAMDAKILLFPINNCQSKVAAGGTHWSLLVYSKGNHVSYHLDSSSGFNNAIAEDFSRCLHDFFSAKFENRVTEVSCPQQHNSYDCGIFVLCLTDIIVEHFLNTKKVGNWDWEPVETMVDYKRAEVDKLIVKLRTELEEAG